MIFFYNIFTKTSPKIVILPCLLQGLSVYICSILYVKMYIYKFVLNLLRVDRFPFTLELFSLLSLNGNTILYNHLTVSKNQEINSRYITIIQCTRFIQISLIFLLMFFIKKIKCIFACIKSNPRFTFKFNCYKKFNCHAFSVSVGIFPLVFHDHSILITQAIYYKAFCPLSDSLMFPYDQIYMF